jgi:Skp family chaperone for outer membrane proteins
VFAVAVALSLALAGAPLSAQAPATSPQGQTPASAPAQPAQPAAAPAPPPAKFLEGVKYGFVNLQVAFVQSAEGQKVQSAFQARQGEIGERDKALQAARQKAQTQASVLSEDARAQLQADLDRQQREFERYVSDAEEEIQRLQQQAEADFQRRFAPVIERIAKEKQLHVVFRETALVWADSGVDLTPEVIAQLGTAAPAPPTAAQKPAAPPTTQKPAGPGR